MFPEGVVSKRGARSPSAGARLGGALASLLLCARAQGAEEPAYVAQVRPFIDSYCISCHGAEKQKGDRRYDTLTSDLSSNDTLQLWQDILDQLNRGEMPPEKAKQPPSEQTQPVIDWITASLRTATVVQASTGGCTILRRLNRDEYSRTIRDLLSLEGMISDPTESFPPDEATHHLNNVGATLVTSDFLLNQYLSAAQAFVERAAVTGPRPVSRKYQFHAPFSSASKHEDGQDVPGHFQNISENSIDDGGFLELAALEKGVPQDGWYSVRVKAQGMNRQYPYDEELVGVHKDEPLRMGVMASKVNSGQRDRHGAVDRELAAFDLPDEAPQWLEARVWLEAGFQPRLTFPNGPSRVKPLRPRLLRSNTEQFREYIDGFLSPHDKELPPGYDIQRLVNGKGDERARKAQASGQISGDIIHSQKNKEEAWSTFYREYQGPRVRVFEVELEGPLVEEWPARSYTALFGADEPTLANAEPILRRFATRAFRRPVQEDELAVLLALVRARSAKGDSELAALKAGAEAVLCSPGFLYLQEKEGELDDYALASRLSYFLWSSMPDEALLAAAAARRLKQPEVLAEQTRRMLASRKAEAFVENFTERWLELYKLGAMPPDTNTFRDYYVDHLEEAMRHETQLFFQTILQENLPIEKFLSADFTFVNGGLARLYDIPGVKGAQFQKVALTDPHRGGLLGQASVLTASANGIDTSPVIRGVWVLENILGTPPNPPPPGTKPLEPDIRGATTIREQLEKHRNVAACAECHRKMDPLGFALENFDPIGAWRTSYRRGKKESVPVDSSGRLPDGHEFTDITELKQLLLARQDQFARCLTEKLLAYASGRLLEPVDRQDVARIVDEAKRQGYGLQDLVLAVVQSRPFRNK